MFRDGVLKSIWQDEISRSENGTLKDDLYDVVIAGAGISGLSCAVSLQKAGLKCIVLEAENIGFGTTGGTTAHLDTFFDAPYDLVIKDFGLEEAKLLAKSGKEAINFIQSNIEEFQIDCDFEYKDGFLFATDEKQAQDLENLYDACVKVGLPIEYTERIP